MNFLNLNHDHRLNLLKAFFCLLVSLAPLQLARAAQPPSDLVAEAVILRPLRVAEVPAEQTGLLREFAIEEGDRVEAGALLAKLDPREAEYALRQAELEVELAVARTTNEVPLRYARKALEVARAELDRSAEVVVANTKSGLEQIEQFEVGGGENLQGLVGGELFALKYA